MLEAEDILRLIENQVRSSKLNIKTEESKLFAVRFLIQQWVQQQGHDRCWYYPEIFRQIASVLDIDLTQSPNDISYEQFVLGCKRFQQEQYKKASL